MNRSSFPPSLIKWTGSKRSQACSIARLFPKNARNYYEPFVGGGAVLYYATDHFQKTYASDLYGPLIEIWNEVKSHPQEVIDCYSENWTALQKDFPNYFYTVRDKFNAQKKGLDLLFLSRTCVNGIIRFNDKGDFNNSLHLSRRGMAPERFSQTVWNWHSRLSNTDFRTGDYASILDMVQKGDFVYLDPPYANSHNRYIDDLDLQRFIGFLHELNSRKVLWALSFDGTRGENDLTYSLPKTLYHYHVLLTSGNSAVKKVLSSSVEQVQESLYLNFVPEQTSASQLTLQFTDS